MIRVIPPSRQEARLMLQAGTISLADYLCFREREVATIAVQSPDHTMRDAADGLQQAQRNSAIC